MIHAIKWMYVCTQNILKSAAIDTSVDVRQEAPSSCLLFIIYVDHKVRMLKTAVTTDGFLGSLHVLLLLVDTVILATCLIL